MARKNNILSNNYENKYQIYLFTLADDRSSMAAHVTCGICPAAIAPNPYVSTHVLSTHFPLYLLHKYIYRTYKFNGTTLCVLLLSN